MSTERSQTQKKASGSSNKASNLGNAEFLMGELRFSFFDYSRRKNKAPVPSAPIANIIAVSAIKYG